MSLAIEPNRVTAVLLADGWHECSCFDLDSYEFIDGESFVLHGGGQSGICATGFAFIDTESGKPLFGPLTSILAVQTDRS